MAGLQTNAVAKRRRTFPYNHTETCRRNIHYLGMSCEDGVRFMALLDDLQRSGEIFMSFRDGAEYTCLLPDKVRKQLPKLPFEMKVERGFRLLTLDRELDWDIVGFLARITEILARANISVGVLSSYSRDHLLIKDEDLETAMFVLRNAIESGSSGASHVN